MPPHYFREKFDDPAIHLMTAEHSGGTEERMNLFEAIMLLCFGASWPFSIAKSLRSGQVGGKSGVFLAIVLTGYLAGIARKLVSTPDWILAIYVSNACMVAFDLLLCLRRRVRGYAFQR